MLASRSLLLGAWIVIAACAGGARRPSTARPMPEETSERHAAMDAFGHRLHAALRAGTIETILLGDDDLRRVLGGEAATRIAARRASIGVRVGVTPHAAATLAPTAYLGVCLQDARDEPAGGTLGLRAPGWTFRRILLAAQQPGGRRLGLWVDGVFVFTDAGFGALDVERVEDPRWEHSDLEIAPCDMATRLR